MKILVTGGDGYLGWSIAMDLADQGHVVTVMDSLVKRKWQMECGSEPLFGLLPLHRRTQAFEKDTGQRIEFFIGDITNVGAIYHIFDLVQPDAVVHCAGQPSAAFSMMNRTNAIVTQENNHTAVLNLLFAVQRAQRDVHLINLGSMGVYGHPGVSIPDGFNAAEHKQTLPPLPFPTQPESYYHLSEAAASQALQFSALNWGLRITDLRMGAVYGIQLKKFAGSDELQTSFNYDAVFGSCVNRFAVQAAIGHPVTVCGDGMQQMAMLNLEDAARGVSLVLAHPPDPGGLRIVNHYSEIRAIVDLAQTVRDCAAGADLPTTIEHIPDYGLPISNPELTAERTFIESLDYEYHRLASVLVPEFFYQILKAKDQIDVSAINRYVPWRKH